MKADPILLMVEPLTREAFQSFGDVIEASEAVQHFTINAGNTERFHDLARLDPGPDGHLIMSIFRGQPRTMPFTVSMMERHPLGSQAFVPLSGHRYLIVVAPREATPVARELRCFLAGPHQGVNYAAGIWHHPLLALEMNSDFLVIDRTGPGENCDELMLTETASIQP